MIVLSLTNEMKELFNKSLIEKYPGIIATSSLDGIPHMALKGSLIVFDEKRISFWDRTFGLTISHIEKNPNVMVLIRNNNTKVGWRFFGKATLVNDDDLTSSIWDKTPQAEKDRDPDKKGVAVIVDIEYILPFTGPPVKIE